MFNAHSRAKDSALVRYNDTMRIFLIILSVILLIASLILGFLIFQNKFMTPAPVGTPTTVETNFDSPSTTDTFSVDTETGTTSEIPATDIPADETSSDSQTDTAATTDAYTETETQTTTTSTTDTELATTEPTVPSTTSTPSVTELDGVFSPIGSYHAEGDVYVDVTEGFIEFGKNFSVDAGSDIYLGRSSVSEGTTYVGSLKSLSGMQRYTLSGVDLSAFNYLEIRSNGESVARATLR